MTYPRDETHDAPAAGEDRLTWTPRADGGYDADLDLEAPRDAQDGTVEVGAASLVEGRLTVHMRVRPVSATAPGAAAPRC